MKIFSIAFALVLTVPSAAQDQSVLEEIQAEMANLREENQRIRAQLDQMNRARDPELDRLLRAQIGMAVDSAMQEVQADRRLTGGWNDGFFLASEDGKFSMEIGTLLQFRAVATHRTNPIQGGGDQLIQNFTNRYGTELTRSDVILRGHVYRPEIQYFINLGVTREWTGLVNGLNFAKDVWLSYDFQNDWRVRIGQFRIHFNREESTPAGHQLAVERSLLNEAINLGRTQGLEFTWTRGRNMLTLTTGDGATDPALQNGLRDVFADPTNPTTPEPINVTALNPDVEWFLAARWERLLYGSWSQFQDMTSPMDSMPGAMLGISFHGQKGETTKGPAQIIADGEDDDGNTLFRVIDDSSKWFSAAADLSWEFGGSSAMVGVMYNWVDNGAYNDTYQIYGLVAQYARYWAPKWESFVRYDWAEFNSESGGFTQADSGVLCFGVNHYLDGHQFKFTTDVNFTIDETDTIFFSDVAGILRDGEDGQQVVLRTQLQLQF